MEAVDKAAERRARKAAAARARRQNPAVREREAEACRQAARRRRQDPAVREREAESRRQSARRRRQDPVVREWEAEAARQRRQDPAVREREAEAARQRRQEDLQNVREREAARKRAYRQADPDAARAREASAKRIRRAQPEDQPSHAAAHPDYAPNLLNEPAPDLRVLMCIRRALQREPPEAIGTSETLPSTAPQPYDSGTQGSSSEIEAAGQENSTSSLSSINKLARKFEEDQAEVAKTGLPSFTDTHTEYVSSLPDDPEPDLRMLMCYRRALQRQAPAASQTKPLAALQPHNSGAQGSSNKTETASQDSSSSLDELARRLEEGHTEEAQAGAEDADQPTKEDPSAEPQVSPETLRHVKDNLQRHLLKLKKKRKKQ